MTLLASLRRQERQTAITELLSKPDPEGMTRGHTWTVDGKADRFDLVPQLARIYIQQHRNEGEEFYARGQLATMPPTGSTAKHLNGR